MSKKMKRVAMDSSSSYMVDEEARARFKHQSLMQDYQELLKDTQALKNQLQGTKQKRSTLKAEVRFLRQRYKHLVAVQSPSTQAEPDPSRFMNTELRGEPLVERRSYRENEALLPNHSVSERRSYKAKEAIQLPNHSVSERRSYKAKETTQLPNHSVSEKRSYKAKEATQLPNHTVFDLNQVSRGEDEEAFQALAPVGTEMLPNNYLGPIGGGDEQPTDLNLPICRGIGNGSSRPGKRKITWSDQVALRV
ncbi:uncharacterized protein LOC122065603 [Macadamia integrifolia]|uniref:uncharacterized protein LOC122065603 n=1 Tax=Macadamia integrifolia TaxID=60698 RepID=UPI001C4FD81A|nr:uncharacterized protein LOC122065603 [Macadamia integrifolia]